MSGITELDELLSSMQPQLLAEEYVFARYQAPLRTMHLLTRLPRLLKLKG
jgi:hypothetical protein